MEIIVEKENKNVKVKNQKIKLNGHVKRELFTFINNAKHLTEDQIEKLLITFVIKE